MSFKDLYTLGTEGSTWSVKQDFDAVFNWDYDDGRAAMMGLYAKGKEMQWDAATRIDWSQELNEDNPEGMPDESMPIHMAPCFLRMPEKEKGNVRRHFQAWQLSQFMQGEQGALICAAKIVTQVPDVGALATPAPRGPIDPRRPRVPRRLESRASDVQPLVANLCYASQPSVAYRYEKERAWPRKASSERS